MIVEAIRLNFLSPIHLGRGTTDLDKTSAVYHSDALKSALYAVGLSYFPEWGTKPDSFFNSFAISSAFPFCQSEFFLPRPHYKMTFKFSETLDDNQRKKAKKISYISASLFRQWAQEPELQIDLHESQISPGGSYLFSRNITAQAFLQAEIQQRVQVPLEGDDENETRPFYFDRLYFKQDSGLYFLVQFVNEDIRSQVLYTLEILGTLGIGTDRTVGNGLFDFNAKVDLSKFELPYNPQGNLRLNLGLYLPTKEELREVDMEKSHWQLIKRGGYLGGSSMEKFMSLRKNNIYFFAEGSVFKTDRALQGRHVNLRPEYNDNDLHPVYRCGQPLFITI
jgi:CRISPR type III-A-associated RAMP protein Csm4